MRYLGPSESCARLLRRLEPQRLLDVGVSCGVAVSVSADSVFDRMLAIVLGTNAQGLNVLCGFFAEMCTAKFGHGSR